MKLHLNLFNCALTVYFTNTVTNATKANLSYLKKMGKKKIIARKQSYFK